ncbi:protocadherin alpha-5-like, partial [Pezoporus wallicus]|uniref:protocadherin alpha-5-like n=1 Tax=Pezoporus wallicus TaxID=35540 RepID=UPI00255027B7
MTPVTLQAQKRRVGGSAPVRAAESPAVSAGGAARAEQESRCIRTAAGSSAGPVPEAAMEMGGVCRGALLVLMLQLAWVLVGGQVRYSVPEEAKAGTVVGRLAQDLGLEAGEPETRRLRLVSQGRRASVEVSGASGALVVSSRLDREELCGKSAPCSLRLEVLVERPLRVFHVELEVTDINDNAPVFPAARKNLSIAEYTTLPGSRFPLEGASDADVGANAQLSYSLSASEHFALDLQRSEEYRESLFLVLKKSLDRETMAIHRLVLTASDGGRPALTGTVDLVISVLDANDNAPQFNQSVYKVQLLENATEGTLVARVNATDPDAGSNAELTFTASNTFPQKGLNIFLLNPETGEIRLTGALDFEDVRSYEIQIEATDQGTPPLSGHCKVVVEVLDVNDNAPEVWVTSLSVPVPEDAAVGTVVALLSVSDRDSGANGRVRCTVWPSAPFDLVSTFAGSYSLVLREALDRERVSEYDVEVRAEDGGAPPLRASRGLRVPVSDVNDNAPAFPQAVYTVLARENNAAGAELARLWARDPDEAGNGRVSYSVAESGGGAAVSGVGWRPASSYVSVDAESGRLWALQPLDYEELQVLQFEVRAVDAGEPALCGNTTVQLFVLDENDNAPVLLPPAGGGPGVGAAGSAASGGLFGAVGVGDVGAPAGQVLAKIRAVDADSGYNAWLRYELWEPRGKGPFRVGLYSGEVSTARALEEADGPRQRLVIVVRDHGEPARSATATLSVSLVEGAEAALVATSSGSLGAGLRPAQSGALAAASAATTTNVWLVVAICVVSSLFLLAVVLYGAARWAPRAAVLSGPGPATLVCASEVGSWSYSQRQSRSLCVADGAGKSDLMVFSPNFPPPPDSAAKVTHPEAPVLLQTVSGAPTLPFPPFLTPAPSSPVAFLARSISRRSLSWESRRIQASAGNSAGPGSMPKAAMAMKMGVCDGALVVVLQLAWALVGGQVRYSVPEEAKAGTVVGRLAQDLGLEAGEPEARRLRLVSQGRRASVEVSGASGALVVSSRLDREELCGKSAPCSLRLEVLVERPLRVFHVELEVTDINDNAPVFPAARKNLSIAELSLPGSRFPLEGASDADVGPNAQLSYSLIPSEHFALDLQKNEEEGESLFLVLRKPLDRETMPIHRLVLTASDGGRPPLTGTMELVISVLDANDNAPQFNQSVYKVQLPENSESGTIVYRVTATDLDEGTNRDVSYSLQSLFPQDGRDVFGIDRKSGEIRLQGDIDFEDIGVYRLQVDAADQGSPPLSGHCKVVVEVLDVNDNAPDVVVTSLSVPVPEDAAVGTVVALLSVSDRDSGANGRVRCTVWPPAPFDL